MSVRDKEEPGGFLGRWSARKRGEDAADDAPQAPVEPAVAPPPAEDERSDEEILAELGLKHPDEIGAGDDVRGFMQAAVPDRLRRLALRALWRSNPALANLDGLVDYGEDFTDGARVVENLQTLYQVGRGHLRPEAPEGGHADDGEAETAAAEAPLEGGSTDPEAESPELEKAPVRPDEERSPPAETADLDDVRGSEPAATRRRMAFRF